MAHRNYITESLIFHFFPKHLFHQTLFSLLTTLDLSVAFDFGNHIFLPLLSCHQYSYVLLVSLWSSISVSLLVFPCLTAPKMLVFLTICPLPFHLTLDFLSWKACSIDIFLYTDDSPNCTCTLVLSLDFHICCSFFTGYFDFSYPKAPLYLSMWSLQNSRHLYLDEKSLPQIQIFSFKKKNPSLSFSTQNIFLLKPYLEKQYHFHHCLPILKSSWKLRIIYFSISVHPSIYLDCH